MLAKKMLSTASPTVRTPSLSYDYKRVVTLVVEVTYQYDGAAPASTAKS